MVLGKLSSKSKQGNISIIVLQMEKREGKTKSESLENCLKNLWNFSDGSLSLSVAR